MEERFALSFDPFVLPFMVGTYFVFAWCIAAIIKVLSQLPAADRHRFYRSLITPQTIVKNIRDIFCDCLLHVRLWKSMSPTGCTCSIIPSSSAIS